MVLEFFKGGADQELEQVADTIRQMLLDNRHTFDAAINAVLGGTDPAIVGPDIRSTDRKVNKAQRAVRRELVVHASVRGDRTDIPLLLSSMSIVKDAERIGDYAKNILDLADAGVDLSNAPDLKQLLKYRDRTSHLLGDAARVFGERDADAAHALLQEGDAWLAEFNAASLAQISSGATADEAVPRALLFRFLKRITAHTMNVLTSLVMPIDRLDFYDESKTDRI